MEYKLKIGASAVIIDNAQKKILLIKRASRLPDFPGYWAFPAGTPDPTDESIKETVIREVKEEVGLNFKPTKRMGFYESSAEDKKIVSLVFLGEWDGKVKIQENEVSGYGWFAYDEIHNKKLLLAFAYSEVIEDLHKKGFL